jgi:hypothetical protein
VPPEFPLMLMVPALALDWLWARTANWPAWKQSVISGAVFVGLLMAAQWPFANFLLSPASRNWVFGTTYFDYNLHPRSQYVRHVFASLEKSAAGFWMEIGIALIAATLTTRLGIGWGEWMRRIRR